MINAGGVEELKMFERFYDRDDADRLAKTVRAEHGLLPLAEN